MPIYEYECENCFCRFELKQSFDDNSIITCPRCQNTARRVFTPVPVIFKGPGFYVTDNRKNGDKAVDVRGEKETFKGGKEKST